MQKNAGGAEGGAKSRDIRRCPETTEKVERGTYGRPRIELPADFEQELKRRIANDESLSKYCNELKMKKSTFYKWVKVYRNSWERWAESAIVYKFKLRI
ncbi:MAG: hypothetical protein ACLTDX_06265 [[Clostridium] innocuum]